PREVLAKGRERLARLLAAVRALGQQVEDRLALGRAAHVADVAVADRDPVLGQRRDERLRHLAVVYDRRPGPVEADQLDSAHQLGIASRVSSARLSSTTILSSKRAPAASMRMRSR